MSKTVYNILRKLLTKEVASRIRLTDKSGKTSFENLAVAKAVTGTEKVLIFMMNQTLKAYFCSEATRALWGVQAANDVIVNDYIGKFFRNTAERKKHGNTAKKRQAQGSERGGEGVEDDPDSDLGDSNTGQ